MFKRLATEEEDRPVSLVKATAIKIPKTETSKYFANKKLPSIPAHIKRAKAVGNECFFLVCMGADYSNSAHFLVNVPEYPPCTQTQFLLASQAWPCNYSHRAEDPVNLQAASSVIRSVVSNPYCFNIASTPIFTLDSHHLKATNKSIGCSGVCAIYDEDLCLYTALDSEHIFGHAILEAVSHISRSKRGYLCTGYTAYIHEEPCMSCAMALVHSRIRRVFCYKTSSNSSFSVSKFNYNRNLNHRFPVYFYMDEPTK
ncbi:tRNA-specific adenosine deaminase 3 [Pancytospora epiphaga]|nr:tRNA-specific adenosine deaminase 3 [Pancytospora epiphaga]